MLSAVVSCLFSAVAVQSAHVDASASASRLSCLFSVAAVQSAHADASASASAGRLSCLFSAAAVQSARVIRLRLPAVSVCCTERAKGAFIDALLLLLLCH